MMTLSAYLAREGLTQTEFGQRIGRSTATVSRICSRRVASVDRETAAAIFRETGECVTPNDLYGLPPREAEPPMRDAA